MENKMFPCFDIYEVEPSTLRCITEDDQLRMQELDIGNNIKMETNTAQKETKHYKKKCLQLQSEINKLMKLIESSMENKNELKKIIITKNKFIKELKSNQGNSKILMEEIFNVTENLTKEKQRSCNLEADLKDKTVKLEQCLAEKREMESNISQQESAFYLKEQCELAQNKLHELGRIETDFRVRVHKLSHQLQIREEELNIEKEGTQNLTSKNMELSENFDKIVLKCEKLDKLVAQYKTKLEIKEGELKQCKDVTALQLLQLEAKITQEAELKNKLKNCEKELKMYELKFKQLSSNNIEVTKDEQAKYLAAQKKIEECTSDNLHKYLAELQERLSKLETLSRESQIKIAEKEKDLQLKIQENKCLQNQLNSATLGVNDVENSLRLKLQVELLEKEQKLQEATDEKLRSLQEKLSEAKQDLHNSMSQQFSQKAEQNATLETLKNEISICKQKIIILEEEKVKMLNRLEHESFNGKKCDDLKRKLEKVTQDRDEKIEKISTFVKLFDDLKILADASAAEKRRLSCENIALQKEANEARFKLEERDNLQSQNASLQEKLEETIRAHNLQVSALKKIESEFQKQLSKHLSECKEAIAVKNKIMHEKEIAIQHIKVTEKELGIKNSELNMKRVELTNLQEEYDILTAKLNKCEEVIKRFNIASEKLRKENQDQAQNILNLEHHIKVLNDNLSQKEKEIALTEQHCQTLNNVDQSLQETANECTKLKNLAENLNQQNNELIEKCKLLEDDLEQFEIKLKTSKKKILSVEEEKKYLIKSMNELTNENSLLHEATNQLALLEMERSSQIEKCRHLTDNCNKLDEELRILRKELIISQETKHELKKQNESFMKIQADLQSKFCTLTEDNKKLRAELVSETEQRRELYIEAERLKGIEALLSSNVDKLLQENNEISKLLSQSQAKIENLQVLNTELVKKCSDFDRKELSYNKDIVQKTSDAMENVNECASLRLKNQGLTTKIMKYINENKKLKLKCKELHNETENQNNLIKNLKQDIVNQEGSNKVLKRYYDNLKHEKEEIQVKNEHLSQSNKELQRYHEKLKHEKEEIQVENEKLSHEKKLLQLEAEAIQRKEQEQAQQLQEVEQMQSKRKKQPVKTNHQPKKDSVPSRTLRACNEIKLLVKRENPSW